MMKLVFGEYKIDMNRLARLPSIYLKTLSTSISLNIR